jgi:vacuolar-type H+-ATPase subunit D/Vma8
MVFDNEIMSHANKVPDINSELDELDREEFYRLKKVRLLVHLVQTALTLSLEGLQ